MSERRWLVAYPAVTDDARWRWRFVVVWPRLWFDVSRDRDGDLHVSAAGRAGDTLWALGFTPNVRVWRWGHIDRGGRQSLNAGPLTFGWRRATILRGAA